MDERSRKQHYYLDQAHDGPIILKSDGGVERLGYEQKQIETVLPSRRSDMVRTQLRKENVLTSLGTYASLADYIKELHEQENQIDVTNFPGDSWTLEDMPDDVQDRFRTWNDTTLFTVERLLQPTTRTLGSYAVDTLIDCPGCNKNPRYTCYESGWERQLYLYPLVSIDGSEVPLNVNQLLNYTVDAVSLETALRFESNGQMSAERRLVLSDTLPGDYIGINGGVEIDLEDKLARRRLKPSVVLEKWDEHRGASLTVVGQDFIDRQDPRILFDALQQSIARRACETVDIHDYDEVYARLLEKVGLTAYELAFTFKNMGMGETDSLLYLTHPQNNFEECEILAYGMGAKDAAINAEQTLCQMLSVQ